LNGKSEIQRTRRAFGALQLTGRNASTLYFPLSVKPFGLTESGKQHVIDRSAGGWRVTAVAAFGDSVFLLESPDSTNDGQRVRVIRGTEKAEMFGQIVALNFLEPKR
jgi:hypothetical protein